MAQRYDVYGVGNALVDLEVQVDDAFLASQGLEKGVMSLASVAEQERALSALGGRRRQEEAGGSAANTMVGVALSGGTAFYSGKVGHDPAGALYRHSMAEAGVEFEVEADAGPTGICLVLVTPDGERTMQSHLGSSGSLSPRDIQTGRISRSRMLYVEGYLWGSPTTAAAARHAMEAARSAGVPVALTLSDPGMVSSRATSYGALRGSGWTSFSATSTRRGPTRAPRPGREPFTPWGSTAPWSS